MSKEESKHKLRLDSVLRALDRRDIERFRRKPKIVMNNLAIRVFMK